MPVSEEIVCVECGSPARLVTHLDPDDELAVGEVVTYRCTECGDRWDLEVTEEDVAEGDLAEP